MSDIHVLHFDGQRAHLVLHFPVPVGNNAVGVSWKTALVESSGLDENGVATTPKTSLRTIDAAEKTKIEAGTIHEHSGMFLVESGGTSSAELLTSLKKFYQQAKADEINRLSVRLKYWGFTAVGV